MSIYEDLATEFHQLYKCAINQEYSVDLLKLRLNLMQEEMSELAIEINTLIQDIETTGKINPDNKINMFKELADLQYVLSGTAVSFNIPLDDVYKKVHESNLSKLVDGKVLYRDDGKILKGPDYMPPDLNSFK